MGDEKKDTYKEDSMKILGETKNKVDEMYDDFKIRKQKEKEEAERKEKESKNDDDDL